jgi:hypothetical protein
MSNHNITIIGVCMPFSIKISRRHLPHRCVIHNHLNFSRWNATISHKPHNLRYFHLKCTLTIALTHLTHCGHSMPSLRGRNFGLTAAPRDILIAAHTNPV